MAGLDVVGVVSGTRRGERLPGSLILPHLQEAGAHVQAGAAIRGAPGDERVAALHHRCQGEGGRRGIVNHGKAHAALMPQPIPHGDSVGAAGGAKKAGRSSTLPALRNGIEVCLVSQDCVG